MYPAPHHDGKLRRSTTDSVLAGVCSGFGRFFGIDPVIVRIVLVLFTLMGGAGIFLYLLCWALMPDSYGRRALTPLLTLLVFFIAIPAMCFLVTLPFRILF